MVRVELFSLFLEEFGASHIHTHETPQSAFICSKLTIEIAEQGVNLELI